MKKILLSFLIVICFFETYSQKVHLILLADEEDGKFGMASLVDEELIYQMHKSVADELVYTLNPILLNKSNFKAAVLRDSISKLKVQPKDIIIFYYTGLGYYPATSKSQFPFFKLKDADSTPLSLDEVANLLLKKGNVFSMVMADCRNTEQKPRPSVLPVYVTENIRKLIVQKLFLNYCGVLKVASAKKGQAVYLNLQNTSSAFTELFCHFYGETLYKAQINEVDNLSLTNFFYNINTNTSNEIAQNYVFERIDCEKKRKKLALNLPSYINAPTYSKINTNFKTLVKEQDLDKRKKIIVELINSFEPNGVIKLTKKFENGQSEQQNIGIKEYLANKEKYNPSLLFLETNISTLKRNKDYTKFLVVEIEEEWK